MGMIKRLFKKRNAAEQAINQEIINDNSKFKPDMSIFLEFKTELNENEPVSSSIKEVYDNGNMLLRYFMQGGSNYNLTQDEEVTMYFTSEAGKHKFPARYSEKSMDGDEAYAKVSRTGPVKINNQRDSFRVKLSVPVKIEVSLADDKSVNFDGETIDLSKSGMRFTTDWCIDEDQEVSVILNTDANREEKLKVSLVRMTESENKYDVRVRLEYTDKSQQDRIYGYVAAKEREEMRSAKLKE